MFRLCSGATRGKNLGALMFRIDASVRDSV